MKRKKLKKWVVWLLRILFIGSVLLGFSDAGNIKEFIISHLIAAVVMALTGYVLVKEANNETK